jgi:hypothetical protein
MSGMIAGCFSSGLLKHSSDMVKELGLTELKNRAIIED